MRIRRQIISRVLPAKRWKSKAFYAFLNIERTWNLAMTFLRYIDRHLPYSGWEDGVHRHPVDTACEGWSDPRNLSWRQPRLLSSLFLQQTDSRSLQKIRLSPTSSWNSLRGRNNEARFTYNCNRATIFIIISRKRRVRYIYIYIWWHTMRTQHRIEIVDRKVAIN